jgi:hypothetical protein
MFWMHQDQSVVKGWLEMSTLDTLHHGKCLEGRGASFRDGMILLAATA